MTEIGNCTEITFRIATVYILVSNIYNLPTFDKVVINTKQCVVGYEYD